MQLRQIYQAELLYSADNEGGPVMPDQPNIVLFKSPPTKALGPYLSDWRLLWCPDVPGQYWQNGGSSYEWRFLAFHPDMASDQEWYQRLVAAYETDPNAYPMMICHTHDRVFYYPSEAHIDPTFTTAFALELRFDGRVVKCRKKYPRGLDPY